MAALTSENIGGQFLHTLLGLERIPSVQADKITRNSRLICRRNTIQSHKSAAWLESLVRNLKQLSGFHIIEVAMIPTASATSK